MTVIMGKEKKFIWEDFINGTYLVDIVYQAAITGPSPGLYRLNEFVSDDYFTRDLHSGAIHPCISVESGSLAEELVFYVSLPCGAEAAYSVMRSNDKVEFSENEFDALKKYEQIICMAIERNWKDIKLDQSNNSDKVLSKITESIDQGLKSFAAGKLTPREKTIVRHMIYGDSVIDTAKLLSITPGTVKNHKKNIYQKLNISSLSDLFSLFIQHISNMNRNKE